MWWQLPIIIVIQEQLKLLHDNLQKQVEQLHNQTSNVSNDDSSWRRGST